MDLLGIKFDWNGLEWKTMTVDVCIYTVFISELTTTIRGRRLSQCMAGDDNVQYMSEVPMIYILKSFTCPSSPPRPDPPSTFRLLLLLLLLLLLFKIIICWNLKSDFTNPLMTKWDINKKIAYKSNCIQCKNFNSNCSNPLWKLIPQKFFLGLLEEDHLP